MTYKPYSARQAMLYEQCGCDSKPSVPGWLIDKLAEQKLTGGFNTRRSNICTKCFVARSANGSCNCT